DLRIPAGQLQPAQARALRVHARSPVPASALAQSSRPRARSGLLVRDPRETRGSGGLGRQRPPSRRARFAGRCLASPTRTTPPSSGCLRRVGPNGYGHWNANDRVGAKAAPPRTEPEVPRSLIANELLRAGQRRAVGMGTAQAALKPPDEWSEANRRTNVM